MTAITLHIGEIYLEGFGSLNPGLIEDALKHELGRLLAGNQALLDTKGSLHVDSLAGLGVELAATDDERVVARKLAVSISASLRLPEHGRPAGMVPGQGTEKSVAAKSKAEGSDKS